MGKGRSVVLGVISFILILTLPFVIMGFSAMQFFYPEVYEKTFNELGVYDSVPALLSQSIGVNVAFPPDFVRSNTNMLIENTLAYIRGETGSLSLSIPIERDFVRSLILQAFNSIPTCPQGILPSNTQVPECFPAGYNKAQFIDSAVSSMQLPEQIDFMALMPQVKGVVDQLKGYASIFYNAFYSLLAVSVVLLVLMIALTFRSPKSMFKWLGVTFLISAIPMLAFSFALTDIVVSAVGPQVGPLMPLVSSMLDALSGSMMLYSGIITVLGIILYAASRMIKEKKK